MTEEMVISLGSEAIKTTLYLAGPLLAAAMVIGIIVSILQAITQKTELELITAQEIEWTNYQQAQLDDVLDKIINQNMIQLAICL